MGGMRRFGTGEKAKPASIYSMFVRVYTHARLEWRSLIAALVCVITVSLLEFVVPQLTRLTIDHIIPDKRSDQLFLIGGGVLGAAIALGCLRFISTSLMASIGQKVLYKLRNDLYRHMQSLDVSFFDRNRTGDHVYCRVLRVRTILGADKEKYECEYSGRSLAGCL